MAVCYPDVLAICCESETISEPMRPLPFELVGSLHVRAQVYQAICLMVFWKPVTMLVRRWHSKVFEGKPWAEIAIQRTLASRAKSCPGSQISRDLGLQMLFRMLLFVVEHGLQAAAYIPAVFGLGGPAFRHSLVRLAGISEVSFEVLDMLERIFAHFCSPHLRGWTMTADVVSLSLHHVMALAMVLPMNKYHSDDYHYALLAFALQGSAALHAICHSYSITLDAYKPSELLQAQVLSVLVALSYILQRAVIFGLCCYKLLLQFYSTGAMFFLVGGFFSCMCMSFVNMVLIYSWCRRAMKFARFSPYDDDSEIAAAEGSAEQISSESEEPFAKVRHQISDFSANVSESNIDSINVKNLLTSRGSYQQKKSDCKQVDLFTD
eukprot:TRINITY_DN15697_c0_g1_i1.p1 TRINITY_DN15697_c0_g1~~TRINITY_DN15697_c0_g1_i1.p1  ORF type:complete len:379 (+),score=63.82 TRINITY_DN15697_c0_g1_i1:56-1192(+)